MKYQDLHKDGFRTIISINKNTRLDGTFIQRGRFIVFVAPFHNNITAGQFYNNLRDEVSQ